MNPQFKEIGEAFMKQFYQLFDEKLSRPHAAEMYHPTESLLSYEGAQFHGRPAIQEKLATLALDKIHRAITTLDCQPLTDGGVIVQVVGQLKNDDVNDKPMPFCQTLIIRPAAGSFFINHDVFRLCLHNMVA